MKRELIGSALAHTALLVLLVLVTSPGASLPPPIPPDQIMNVTPVDALPAGMVNIPEVDVPSHAADVATPDEVPRVSIPEPEAIPVEPRPRDEPPPDQPKPKPRPQVQREATPPPVAQEEQGAGSDEIFESRVQSGAGAVTSGSLLGVQSGRSGGRAGTYPDRIVNKVYYSWRNPAKLPDTIICSVVFRVDEGGRASQIALERSSGMPVFDNSTVRAVYEAAPYPPFPRSMRQEYIVMRIIFEYVP